MAHTNGVCNSAKKEDDGKWNFKPSENLMECHDMKGVRGIVYQVMSNLDPNGKKPVIPLAHGDPAAFDCFKPPLQAVEALKSVITAAKHNTYCQPNGLVQTRRVVADHLSHSLPYKLSEDDIYMTCGTAQAIELIIPVLASKGSNFLLPRPGYPQYEALLAFHGIECRFYDLVPEKDWEINLNQLAEIADNKTVAMLIINPNNPCGSVFKSDHLLKVAEAAKNFGFLIISDEVYADMVFDDAKFLPMGQFASTAPVITVGSISKKFVVPGWRVGWLVTCDPDGILKTSQAAIPAFLESTPKEFHIKMSQSFSEGAKLCYNNIQKIDLLHCPSKPKGSMFMLVKIDVSGFSDLQDDIEFCAKLAKEESVVVLPGTPLGMKNWVRLTFALPLELLEEAFGRIEAFCSRHFKSVQKL